MGFWDGFRDLGVALFNQREWERQRISRQNQVDDRYLQQRGINASALRAFVQKAQAGLSERTERQRAMGHNIKMAPQVQEGMFDDQPAIAKFFENGNPDRLDIYYGGTGDVPLQNNDHGHVVVDLASDQIIEWLTPGTRGQRERLI